jgi:riboflavin kinase/FMN adenylyltransferase
VTESAPPRDAGEQLWSSTRIREHLQQGEVEEAAQILGRTWEIEGEVVTGDGAGRTLGYPTANLNLDSYLRPRFGVYAVRTKIDGKMHKGVANLGVRPTVKGRDERFEVHLFDFAGDLYGQHLRVEMAGFIRPEQAFASRDALKAQIAQDCLAAKARLA